MSGIISVLLPLFALILIGYICRRTNRLGPAAASEINKFVVWLGLPALLFKATATAVWADIWQPHFVAAFTLGSLAIFCLTLGLRLYQTRHLVDASIDALGSSYANTGFIGIPLCVLVFGPAGLQPSIIATLIVVCLLFALSLVVIEIGLQTDGKPVHPAKQMAGIVWSLLKNPLVISPVVGAGWAAGGETLPVPVVRFLDLLSGATTPCALVSIGLFLAGPHQAGPHQAGPHQAGPHQAGPHQAGPHSDKKKTDPFSFSGSFGGALMLVLLKLVAQPLLTGFLVYRLFALPPVWAHCALLLSALPTGTGPFMLAEFYRREADVVSKTILWSTLGSVVTLSACLYWIKTH